jgi:hypothetical protein
LPTPSAKFLPKGFLGEKIDKSPRRETRQPAIDRQSREPMTGGPELDLGTFSAIGAPSTDDKLVRD